MAQKLNVADLRLRSPGFQGHKSIPQRHAGDGEDVAPALEWSGVPEGTKAFAIVVHDPDAPLIDGFTHWVVYGIPAEVRSLPEGGGTEYVQGSNGMGKPGWMPAAPPPGHGTHHYFFHLYAVGGSPDLPEGLSMAD